MKGAIENLQRRVAHAARGLLSASRRKDGMGLPHTSDAYFSMSPAGRRRQHASRVRYPALLVFLALSASAAEPKITYADHVLPIFRNACLNCHNPDKQKAGLDLSSYEKTMAGSDSGKIVEPGNSGGSLLVRLITHADEPKMPAKADKLPDSEIETIKKWIEGNAPENAGSVVAKKANDIPDAPVAGEEKPDGPAPMPRDLVVEPCVRTKQAGAVAALAASPWAPLVAVGGQKQVLLYQTESLEIAGVLAFPEGYPNVVRFDRGGALLLAAGGIGAKSGRVVVWDVETGARVAEAGDEFDAVLAADISPDHSRIALGGPGKLVKIFDAKDGRLLFKIKKHTDWVTAMSYSSDGKWLVTGDRAGGLAVWDAQGREMFVLTGHKGAITAVSCRGGVAATASEDGTIRLWNLKEGTQVKSWEAHKEGALSVEFASDGRLVSCGRDRLAKVWDKSGKQLRASEPLADVALRATLSGGRLIASDWTGAVCVWSVADGKRIGDLAANPPTLAERAAEAAKRLAEAQVDQEKQTTQLRQAELSVKDLTEQVRVTGAAVSEKEKHAKAAEMQVAMLEKTFAESEAALRKAADDLTQLQKSAETLEKTSAQAMTASETSARELRERGTLMADKQALAMRLSEAANKAREAADKSPDDKALAEAASQARAASEKAMEELAALQKDNNSKADEARRLADGAAKAVEAAKQNEAAVDAQKHAMDGKGSAVEKARSELAAAKEMNAKAKAEFASVTKSLPPKAAQAKAAEDALARAKSDAMAAAKQLAVAQAETAKWKAAQINVALHEARRTLAEREAERSKVTDAASKSAGEAEKAVAEVKAKVEKLVAEYEALRREAQEKIDFASKN